MSQSRRCQRDQLSHQQLLRGSLDRHHDLLSRDNFHKLESMDAKTDIMDTLLVERFVPHCCAFQTFEVLTSGSQNLFDVVFQIAVTQVSFSLRALARSVPAHALFVPGMSFVLQCSER